MLEADKGSQNLVLSPIKFSIVLSSFERYTEWMPLRMLQQVI